MKKTFKSLKSGKVWVMLLIAAAFLVTCGVVVYAAHGFVEQHNKSENSNVLTASEWDQVMRQIDGLGMYGN